MTNHQHISSFDSRLTLYLTPSFKNNAFTPRTKLIEYKSHCTPSFFWQHRRLTPSYMHTSRPITGNTIPGAHANQFPQIHGFPEISDVKYEIAGWRLMESIVDFFGWSDPIRWARSRSAASSSIAEEWNDGGSTTRQSGWKMRMANEWNGFIQSNESLLAKNGSAATYTWSLGPLAQLGGSNGKWNLTVQKFLTSFSDLWMNHQQCVSKVATCPDCQVYVDFGKNSNKIGISKSLIVHRYFYFRGQSVSLQMHV